MLWGRGCIARVLPLLAVVATGWGQAPPFACNYTAGAPPIVREGGLSEATADTFLTCTGGIFGQQIVVNIQLFLNTVYTGRLIPGPPLTVGQTVHRGRQVQQNSVVWTGVTLTAPGTTGTLVVQISEIRARATNPTSPVQAFLSTSGATSVPVNNPIQTVAVTIAGAPLTTAIRRPDDSSSFVAAIPNCQANKTVVDGRTAPDFNVKFTENDATILKTASGIETQSSRLMARFFGIPAGASLFVTTAPVAAGTTLGLSTAALTVTDQNGAGPFTPVAATNGPYARVAVVGGAAVVVWELIIADTFTQDSLSFGVVISMPASPNVTANITVRAGLGPLSLINIADDAAPIPRYTDFTTQVAAAAVVACAAPLSISTTCPLADGAIGAVYNEVLTATGGTFPYIWTLDSGALPAGLRLNGVGLVQGTPTAAGVFAMRFRVRDGAQATVTLDCTIRVAGGFSTSANNLVFDGPGSQTLSIVSDEPGIPFTATLAFGGTAQFIRLSAVAGTLPTSLILTAIATNLQPGPNAATLTIASNSARPSSRTVGIVFNAPVPAPPGLDVSPAGLEVTVPAGASARRQLIVFTNRGTAPATYTLTNLTTVTGGPWLAVTPATRTLAGGERFSAVVTFDPAGVPAGSHLGSLAFTTRETGDVTTVSATLTVAGNELIGISPEGATFTVVENGPSPPAQNFRIFNEGAIGFTWTAVIAYPAAPAGWLSLSQTAGQVRPGVSSSVDLIVNQSGIGAGVHSALVEVRAPGAANSPRRFVVVLNVLPPGQDPGPLIRPAGVLFAAPVGGPAPSRRIIEIVNISGASFTFVPQLQGDPAIFSFTTPLGTAVPSGGRATIVVAADSTKSAATVIRAGLALQFSSDGLVRVVDLVLIVAPGIAPTASRQAAGCTPTSLEFVSTVLTGLNFSVPAGAPIQAEAEVRDNCGEPFTEREGVVTVLPSTDPSAQIMRSNDRGVWRRSLQFKVTPNVSITFDANNAAGTLSASRTVLGSAALSIPTPAIDAGGVTSAASFARFRPVAAGGIISIFGAQLAQRLEVGPGPPLATQLGGATVSVLGVDRVHTAPMYFASDRQLNALIPLDVPPGPRQLLVRRVGGGTATFPLQVRASQPAVFILDPTRFPCDQGAITNAAGLVPTSGIPCVPCQAPQQCATPAPPLTVGRGEVIVIYAEGLGGVDRVVAAGSPSPAAEPFARLTDGIVVRIGGAQVPQGDILYAGLAPGFAGLYQVNVIVPMAVQPGPEVEVELVENVPGGERSNRAIIAVR